MTWDAASKQVRSEILKSLEYDIISFPEIEGLAMEAGFSVRTERRKMILDLLCELAASGQILIGDALKATGCVEFHPWRESGTLLRERLERIAASSKEPFVGEEFWVGRPSDAV